MFLGTAGMVYDINLLSKKLDEIATKPNGAAEFIRDISDHLQTSLNKILTDTWSAEQVNNQGAENVDTAPKVEQTNTISNVIVSNESVKQ